MSYGRGIASRLTRGPERRWTQSEITQLRSLLAAGSTASDAAGSLGRSLLDVEALMSRLRLRSR